MDAMTRLACTGLVLALTLAGCGSGSASVGADKAGDDTGGSAAGDEGGDDGDVAEDGPSILDMDAYCYINDEGEDDEYIAWIVSITGAHTLGTHNLETFQVDAVTVSSEGTALASYALVCDDNGGCTGTWSSQEDGIGCVTPDIYTVEAVLMDVDGLSSEPASVVGRRADTAGG